MRCRARGRAAAARRRCARRRVNREREAARWRARGGAGVSGGAGEGARTRSNGRFTRVVNRKAASPSSATPRGSIEWPRGGAHERVELLAALGQRLRARGERVERRGAQQQGSSVRRPQCCGDAGECCAQRCPHLSFMSRCHSAAVVLSAVACFAALQKEQNESSTRTKDDPSRLPDPELNRAPRSGPRRKATRARTALRMRVGGHATSLYCSIRAPEGCPRAHTALKDSVTARARGPGRRAAPNHSAKPSVGALAARGRS